MGVRKDSGSKVRGRMSSWTFAAKSPDRASAGKPRFACFMAMSHVEVALFDGNFTDIADTARNRELLEV